MDLAEKERENRFLMVDWEWVRMETGRIRWGGIEGESTGRDDWNWGTFLG